MCWLCLPKYSISQTFPVNDYLKTIEWLEWVSKGIIFKFQLEDENRNPITDLLDWREGIEWWKQNPVEAKYITLYW